MFKVKIHKIKINDCWSLPVQLRARDPDGGHAGAAAPCQHYITQSSAGREEAGLYLPTPAESWETEGRKTDRNRSGKKMLVRPTQSVWVTEPNPPDPDWADPGLVRVHLYPGSTWDSLKISQHLLKQEVRQEPQTWWVSLSTPNLQNGSEL